MEVLAKQSEWLATDEERLAAFLDSETGKRFLPRLLEQMPTLLGVGDTNAILIRSGEVRAYQQVVETIISLAHPPAPMKPAPNEYPRLEDDTAWNDGHKLETPEKNTQ